VDAYVKELKERKKVEVELWKGGGESTKMSTIEYQNSVLRESLVRAKLPRGC
jgi:hypothetical protein